MNEEKRIAKAEYIQDLNAEIEEDRIRELAQETSDGEQDSWISDNIIELRKDFIEETCQTEFDQYCNERQKEAKQ